MKAVISHVKAKNKIKKDIAITCIENTKQNEFIYYYYF